LQGGPKSAYGKRLLARQAAYYRLRFLKQLIPNAIDLPSGHPKLTCNLGQAYSPSDMRAWTSSRSMRRLPPVYTPLRFALAIPSAWRSRRRFVSNSANTPSMSKNALPAAVLPVTSRIWPGGSSGIGLKADVSNMLGHVCFRPSSGNGHGPSPVCSPGPLTAPAVLRRPKSRIVAP